MSRPVVIFIVLVVVIAAVLFFLARQAQEIPTQPVEVDVTNEVGK